MSNAALYQSVMSRREQIMRRALGIDYGDYERTAIAFDYEALMNNHGLSIDQVRSIQASTGVGNTPLVELYNITEVVRRTAPAGKGARLFVKDEAANPSGSFKDRRASVSCYMAQQLGYSGVVAATSGNYGAAVASQAAKRGLRCVIVQEAFDSRGVGQPEILEKGRACEGYGAEVMQLSVGPELFYVMLRVLEETGYFNASLYTPYGIAGIETLGYELVEQLHAREGRGPDAVVVTHAGGGNVTGTARGLHGAGWDQAALIGASVDLSGLHMASDSDFNRKSFTTGHSGFGIPFTTRPDRTDVPRNAARSLRYLDRYVTVSQGEVFYATEMLAQLEGMQRGPAGATSLAAAIAIARELDRDQIVVVQETEYTGAGKHHHAQLSFAVEQGVQVVRGDPAGNRPGQRIVIPESPAQLRVTDLNLDDLRRSYVRNAVETAGQKVDPAVDIPFLMEETKASRELVIEVMAKLGVRLDGPG